MQVSIRASTGTAVLVWHQFDSYYARRADGAGTPEEPQICLGVDLFEVIADLAGLDLDAADEAAEAVRLAEDAQRSLTEPAEEDIDSDRERRCS